MLVTGYFVRRSFSGGVLDAGSSEFRSKAEMDF